MPAPALPARVRRHSTRWSKKCCGCCTPRCRSRSSCTGSTLRGSRERTGQTGERAQECRRAQRQIAPAHEGPCFHTTRALLRCPPKLPAGKGASCLRATQAREEPLAGKCALGSALILGESLVKELLLPVGQGLLQEADVECVHKLRALIGRQLESFFFDLGLGHGYSVCASRRASRPHRAGYPAVVAAAAGGSAPGTGRKTRKVVPRPMRLSTSTWPPWDWARCLTIARPRPVPPSSRARPLSTR